jgi:DNA-binding transcriptional MerR regulator
MKLGLQANRWPKIPTDMYGATETAREARVTLRQLQWWDEHGIITPIQMLHRRLYTREQVELATRFGQLRKAGVPLRRLAKYAKLPWTSVVQVRAGKPTLVGNVLVVC